MKAFQKEKHDTALQVNCQKYMRT